MENVTVQQGQHGLINNLSAKNKEDVIALAAVMFNWSQNTVGHYGIIPKASTLANEYRKGEVCLFIYKCKHQIALLSFKI